MPSKQTIDWGNDPILHTLAKAASDSIFAANVSINGGAEANFQINRPKVDQGDLPLPRARSFREIWRDEAASWTICCDCISSFGSAVTPYRCCHLNFNIVKNQLGAKLLYNSDFLMSDIIQSYPQRTFVWWRKPILLMRNHTVCTVALYFAKCV